MLLIPDNDGVSNTLAAADKPFSEIVSGYSGYVMFHKWGSFNDNVGYYLKNGKILYKSGSSDTERAQEMYCYEVVTEFWYRVCGGGECSELRLAYSDVETYCVYVPSNIHAQQESDLPAEYLIGGGGGVFVEDIIVGSRPLAEFANKCEGLALTWNNYPNKEVLSYVTQDGHLLMVAILPLSGGGKHTAPVFRPENGKYYYKVLIGSIPLALSYEGMIKEEGYYYIPIVASVHTHSACRTDMTTGISQGVGDDDEAFAKLYPGLNHWVIGCNVIAQTNTVIISTDIPERLNKPAQTFNNTEYENFLHLFFLIRTFGRVICPKN